ncbi:MAG: tyrosine-type recombinase/integrase [Arcobacteraceae bacterium]|nr:tyrosine-type recombinase/integrase [Arcobacteraceae bacterium]
MKEKFYKYLKEFCEYLLDLKNYSQLTVKTYNTPIAEAIKISEIYEENGKIIFDITKFRIQIASLNPKTINKKISSINSFIKYLESKNIAIKLVGNNTIKSPQTLPKPIQTKNIFESLEEATIQEKLIIVFIYSFGLRISELASLKLEDIKTTSIQVTGKGNKQREIPATDIIQVLLQEYLEVYTPKKYLFEEDEKALTTRQLQYRLEKAFKRIGIKASPHQLRHSFATDLLNDGARINDISELLGHSSLKATGIYTKLTTNTKLKQYNNAHPLNK